MKIFLIVLAGLALILIGGMIALYYAFGMPQSLAIKRHYYHIIEFGDHAAILNAAIRTIQSTTEGKMYQVSSDVASITNLPPELQALHPRTAVIDSETMMLELHGGFVHYGFTIDRQMGYWTLTAYTDDERRVLTNSPTYKHIIIGEHVPAGDAVPLRGPRP